MVFTNEQRCGLVIMVELRRSKDIHSVTSQWVAQRYGISLCLIESVLAILIKADLVVKVKNDEYVIHCDDKKTSLYDIAQAINAVMGVEAAVEDRGKLDGVAHSSVVMIEKEMEKIEDNVRCKLKRLNLADFCEKTNRTVYI